MSLTEYAANRDLPALLDVHEEQLARSTSLWHDFGPELDDSYNKMLLGLTVHPEAVKQQSGLKIVYTPLHGA
jgi:phosphoglucomutase